MRVEGESHKSSSGRLQWEFFLCELNRSSSRRVVEKLARQTIVSGRGSFL